MKTIRVFLAGLVCLGGGSLSALEIPPGGEEISDPAGLSFHADTSVGTAVKIPATGGHPGGVRIEIKTPAPHKSYLAQVRVPCPKGALAKGDKVLAIVKGRAVGGEQAAVDLSLQLFNEPYTQAARGTGLTLSSAWQEYPVLFEVEQPLPAGGAAFSVSCARAAHTVEIAGLRVLRYPPGTANSLFPRVRRTYAGREPDAPWRKTALERIEAIRKADCSLTLTGPDGKPLVNTPVKLTLRRHEFGFGSATPAHFYVREDEDGHRYREVIDRLFSIVVFENDLKDLWWGRNASPEERVARNQELDQAFAWLGQRNIAVRGHYLMQEAIQGKIAKWDSETVRDHLLKTARERIEFAGDRVCEWDAINHPIGWSGVELFHRRPGLEHLSRDVFRLARSLTKLPLMVNEDQVFRPGPQCDDTWEFIRQLNQEGLKVDGLGNQAHIDESYLPSPEHVLAVTDRFAQVVPRQAITEFDLVTSGDEELAADYTRDMLIACFSHPAYSSFLLWGFWEGSHWLPAAASWKKDWSILPRGEVLEEWIGRRWRTELTLSTDAEGKVSWRGFTGWYEITFPAGGAPRSAHVTREKPAAAVPAPGAD